MGRLHQTQIAIASGSARGGMRVPFNQELEMGGLSNCYKIVTSNLWTPFEAPFILTNCMGGVDSVFTRP
jgi:hypothetical protein